MSIHAFLKIRFKKEDITDIELIGKGCFSEAYSFTHEGIQKIIRINDNDQDFKKDQWAFETLKNLSVPIPKVEEIGFYDQKHFYCISDRCLGKTYNALSLEEKKTAIPVIFQTLEMIHLLDISQSTGFGLIDLHGNGQFSSWAESLLNLENHKIPYNFKKLYKRSYFDKAFFDETYQQLSILVETLPLKRFFVHGDFGFDNLLVNKNKITGVIDWGEARIGDPIYDVAWLEYWSDDISFLEWFLEQLTLQERHPFMLFERLRACFYHIGLGGMLFFTHFDHVENYHDAVRRLKRVLSSCGGS